MAINPNLVSIIPASDLPMGDPTNEGQFFFYEGDVMKKAPMTNIYDKVTSGIKGTATQANAPTTYSAETHPDGLIETYRAVEPLNNTSAWYTLADATNKAKFPITQDMLNANDVLLTATNGVVSVFLNAKIKGDSAYEVAVDNGFVGTEAEWLASLEGVQDIALLTGVNAPDEIANYASETWVSGQYITPNGTIGSAGTFNYCSTYINIIGGEKYSFTSNGYAIAWYDASQVFISLSGEGADGVALRTFTAPVNAVFARVNQTDAILPTFSMKKEGITIPSLKINLNQIEGYEPVIIEDSDFTKPTFQTVVSGLDFANYPITGNIIISGDSTVAEYAGGVSISSILTATGTKTDFSIPGHTINEQLSYWNVLGPSQISGANYVFLQVGLNDMNPAEPANDAISRLQTYVNKIKTDCPNAVLIVGTMLPCKQRFIDLYGAVDGLVAWEKWKIFNYFIENKLILKADVAAYLHSYHLADADGNLAAEFNTGDNIHENTLGRKIIAYSWLSAISHLL